MIRSSEITSFSFSFVIPTVGRASSLAILVDQIESIVHEQHEIIVVYDGVDFSTEQQLDSLFARNPQVPVRLEFLHQRLGPSAARNHAIYLAQYQVCVFLDDDITIDASWWRSLHSSLIKGTSCLTGPILTQEKSLLARARAQRYMARYRGLEDGTSVRFFAGGNAAVYRESLLAVGGFPDVQVGSDNLIINKLSEIGIECSFIGGMAVWHQHDRGLRNALTCAFKSGHIAGNGTLHRELFSMTRAVTDFREILPFLVNLFFLFIKMAGTFTKSEKA